MIKRYIKTLSGFQQNPEGEWVRFEDHDAAMKEKDERIAQLEHAHLTRNNLTFDRLNELCEKERRLEVLEKNNAKPTEV